MKSVTSRLFTMFVFCMVLSVGMSLLVTWLLSKWLNMTFHAATIATISALICAAMTIVQVTAARRMT